MDRLFAVMNTDLINKHGIRFPSHVLAESIETMVESCVRRNLPVGTPTHNAHDIHRPIGWSVGTELYVTADMTRQIGEIFMVDTAHERDALADLCKSFWAAYHTESIAPFRDELESRLAAVNLSDADYLMTEAACVVRPGLAAELYPQFFDPGGALVDKDGLVDMTAFLATVTQLDSGVFHDRQYDLLLFAHPSFRRSLSRRNRLNGYFLDIFREVAEDPALGPRLRLDPDMLGYPASARRPIELEYWRGPRFSEDISAIPYGVAEHKASGGQRDLEGIDKTQIWWKHPEAREDKATGRAPSYRTFECEELIEHPSGGLGEDVFGCRYTHAEYDMERHVISHFDGAIRAYTGDAYLARLDVAIDRSGKQAQYTKLFRFDGAVPVNVWKRLLTGYYRGNTLIPEYFGEPSNSAEPANAQTDANHPTPPGPTGTPALSALVSFHPPRDDHGVSILSSDHIQLASRKLEVTEIGDGSVAAFVKARCDLTGVVTFAADDDVLNLSPLTIGQDRLGDWKVILSDLADALDADAGTGRTAHASCSILWDAAVCGLRLSIAGEALLTASLIRECAEIIDPTQGAAAWFEAFDLALKRLAPKETSAPAWARIRPKPGRLQTPRSGPCEVTFMVPEQLIDEELMSAVSNAAAQG